MRKGQSGYLLIQLFQSTRPERANRAFTPNLSAIRRGAADGFSILQSVFSPVVVFADQTKIFGSKWLLIIEHAIDHTLPPQSTQHPEEAGLAEMHPVVLAVMLRAISPLGFKLAVLEAIAGNSRARAAHVADHILN